MYAYFYNEHDEQGIMHAHIVVNLKCLTEPRTWKSINFQSDFMGKADYDMPS